MAEPSRMGISSLSISTRALDIPRPGLIEKSSPKKIGFE